MDNHQLNGKKPEDFIDLSDYQQPTCTKDQVSEVIKRLYGQKFTAHQICNILVKLYYREESVDKLRETVRKCLYDLQKDLEIHVVEHGHDDQG